MFQGMHEILAPLLLVIYEDYTAFEQAKQMSVIKCVMNHNIFSFKFIRNEINNYVYFLLLVRLLMK